MRVHCDECVAGEYLIKVSTRRQHIEICCRIYKSQSLQCFSYQNCNCHSDKKSPEKMLRLKCDKNSGVLLMGRPAGSLMTRPTLLKTLHFYTIHSAYIEVLVLVSRVQLFICTSIIIIKCTMLNYQLYIVQSPIADFCWIFAI